MLEVKVRNLTDCFNRYIVECKYRIEAGDFGNGRVLIDT